MAGLKGVFTSTTNSPKKKPTPGEADLFRLNDPDNPLCLFGHFNMKRKFGIEQHYPNARQFMTMLRNPYERLLSQYFFLRKNADTLELTEAAQKDLEEYVLTNKSSFLDHFPREVTHDNYKDICEEFFVEIGISERMNESLARFAKSLGMAYDGETPHLNQTSRDQDVSDLARERFREMHDLEFVVYDHAVSLFEKAEAGQVAQEFL